MCRCSDAHTVFKSHLPAFQFEQQEEAIEEVVASAGTGGHKVARSRLEALPSCALGTSKD